ncbi:MAG: C13 family peptidase [Thermomonas sp.]
MKPRRRIVRNAALLGLLLASVATSAASRKIDPADAIANRDETLVAKEIAALPAQRPGTIDLYAIGVAGDGTENVFRNEAEYFEALVRTRFHARGVITLVSNPDSVGGKPRPLASYDNLYDAVTGVARRMDKREDILLLYMTMHGTHDHELALYFPPYVEDALTPDDLRFVLRKAGIRNRVIAISACYSGGFIPVLKGDDTLIMTAARSDRPSFGCGADSTATFFGRAWLVEGLNRSTDFAAAFRHAQARIQAWEKLEGDDPSHPQISEGKAIAGRLASWRSQLVPGPAVAYPWPLDDLDHPQDQGEQP